MIAIQRSSCDLLRFLSFVDEQDKKDLIEIDSAVVVNTLIDVLIVDSTGRLHV
jgi:hypothetical protein